MSDTVYLPIPRENVPLDLMMDREQCAAWLGVSVGWLAADAALSYPKIPMFKLGHKTPRYHPRTILATLASRARVAPETIAASFGTNQKGTL